MSGSFHVLLSTALWILFFFLQVTILKEFPLTMVALCISGTLLYNSVKGELHLFFFGVGMALVIELGLGLIARSQHWEHASLFGIPFWLPLIWGYGFVVMRRIGNVMVNWANRH